MLEKPLLRPRKMKARRSVNKETRQMAPRILCRFPFRQPNQSRQRFPAGITHFAKAFAIIAPEAGTSIDHFQACLIADRVGQEFLQMESAQRVMKGFTLFLTDGQE